MSYLTQVFDLSKLGSTDLFHEMPFLVPFRRCLISDLAKCLRVKSSRSSESMQQYFDVCGSCGITSRDTSSLLSQVLFSCVFVFVRELAFRITQVAMPDHLIFLNFASITGFFGKRILLLRTTQNCQEEDWIYIVEGQEAES